MWRDVPRMGYPQAALFARAEVSRVMRTSEGGLGGGGEEGGKNEPRSTTTRFVTPSAVSVVICTGPR